MRKRKGTNYARLISIIIGENELGVFDRARNSIGARFAFHPGGISWRKVCQMWEQRNEVKGCCGKKAEHGRTLATGCTRTHSTIGTAESHFTIDNRRRRHAPNAPSVYSTKAKNLFLSSRSKALPASEYGRNIRRRNGNATCVEILLYIHSTFYERGGVRGHVVRWYAG